MTETEIAGGQDPASGEAQLPPYDQSLPPWEGGVESAGGVRLHVRRTPQAAGASTAVYVHGLGGSSTNWTDLGALLAPFSNGIAVDLPGFGFSEPPADFNYSLAGHADTVADFVAGLGAGPVHLHGNSMGGAIAALIAARRPELVRTLTLISPAVRDLRLNPRRLSDPRMALTLLPVVGPRVRRQLAAVPPAQRVRQVIGLCFAEPNSCSEQRIAEMVTEHSERASLRWALPAMERSTSEIIKTWLTPGVDRVSSALREVTAPTLVVWGDQDKVISPSKAMRTVRLLRDGRLLVLPRTGHVAQMERPVAVAGAVLGMWQAEHSGNWLGNG